MVNWQSIKASGASIVGALAASTKLVFAGSGKLLGVFASTTNSSPVYCQVFDVATVAGAEVGGTWAVNPIFQFVVSGANPFTRFSVPVPLANGCVILMSTSATGYVSDSNAVFMGAQVVADLNSPIVPLQS